MRHHLLLWAFGLVLSTSLAGVQARPVEPPPPPTATDPVAQALASRLAGLDAELRQKHYPDPQDLSPPTPAPFDPDRAQAVVIAPTTPDWPRVPANPKYTPSL
ncbi:hypothetical protein RHOSPDRAFT_37291 [Rhodotorula sp. JG-1b]|nr:hypothetical protein RHOSPDRAFT_37291 [Rhodotorula sp. JG-1b]